MNLEQAVQRIAFEYDQQIWLDEMLMGLGIVRWWICRDLKGKVLEVSCGTGRNLQHYSKDAAVTATDLSESMLAIARAKVKVWTQDTFTGKKKEGVSLGHRILK